MKVDSLFLSLTIDRLCEDSYKFLKMWNIADEAIPCPTIIKIIDDTDLGKNNVKNGNIMTIWTMEDLATINLKSISRSIISVKKIEEYIEIDIIKGIIFNEIFWAICEKNITPTDPILIMILAKIIEQDPDALTWAFVNQKWKNITGILIDNISINITNIMMFSSQKLL